MIPKRIPIFEKTNKQQRRFQSHWGTCITGTTYTYVIKMYDGFENNLVPLYMYARRVLTAERLSAYSIVQSIRI